MVLNSLGAYLGQIPIVALGVLGTTSEYATGTIRATIAAMPWRSKVVSAKAAVLAVPVIAVGIAASAASFLLGQPILHNNGFVPAQGYPLVSLADPSAVRAVVGTALYLATVSGLLYAPAVVSLMLAEPLRGTLQRLSPMMAGLAVQRTVERADSVPIGPWAGAA